jgi:hypothetical protein
MVRQVYIIPALGRLRQEDYEFKASMDYIARLPLKKKKKKSRMLMAHTCNPCSSGVRDQEDHGTKPAQGNSS